MSAHPRVSQSLDDLEQDEANWRRGGEAPSAKVVRVSKPGNKRKQEDASPKPMEAGESPFAVERDVVSLGEMPSASALDAAVGGSRPKKKTRFAETLASSRQIPNRQDVEMEDDDPMARLDRADVSVANPTVMSAVMERDVSDPALFAAPTPRQGAFPAARHRFQDPVRNPERPLHKRAAGRSAEVPRSDEDDIHDKNMNKIAAMSEDEIAKARAELFKTLDPAVVRRLQAIGAKKDTERAAKTGQKPLYKPMPAEPVLPAEVREAMDSTPSLAKSAGVERDKVEWMEDIVSTARPGPSAAAKKTIDHQPEMPLIPADAPRFDFDGNLLAIAADVPVTAGLHHHGETPDRAGYAVEELMHLMRSQVPSQRVITLQSLTAIIRRAWQGDYKEKTADILTRLVRPDALILFRAGMDDSGVASIVASVQAMHALLVAPHDEVVYDALETEYRGHEVFPLKPTEEETDVKPNDAPGAASDVVQDSELLAKDIMLGLTRINLAERICFTLHTLRIPAAVDMLLDILIALCRHSMTLCSHVATCNKLLDILKTEFIAHDTTAAVTTHHPYQSPVVKAIKLARVIASGGRSLAEAVVEAGILAATKRFLFVDEAEFKNDSSLAAQLSIEALRLWRVALAYGLDLDSFAPLLQQLIEPMIALTSSLQRASGEGVALPRLQTQRLVALFHASEAAARCTDATDDAEAATLAWSLVSQLVDPAVRVLSQTMATAGATTTPAPTPAAALSRVAGAAADFLATYFERLRRSAPHVNSPMEALTQVEHLVRTSLGACFASDALTRACGEVSRARPEGDAVVMTMRHGGIGHMPLETALHDEGRRAAVALLHGVTRMAGAIVTLHKAMAPLVMPNLVAGLDAPLNALGSMPLLLKSEPLRLYQLRLETHCIVQILFLAAQWRDLAIGLNATPPPFSHHVGHALSAVARAVPGDEALVGRLLREVVFLPSCLLAMAAPLAAPGSATEQTAAEGVANITAGLAAMSTEAPNSAAGLEALVIDWRNRLAEVFIQWAAPDTVLDASFALVRGPPDSVTSLLLPVATSILPLPADFLFMPISNSYAQLPPGGEMPADDAALMTPVISAVLQLAWALEITRSPYSRVLNSGVKIYRAMQVFLLSSSFFRTRPIHALLGSLFDAICTPVGSRAPSIDLDYLNASGILTPIATTLLEHYADVSVGDPIYTQYVMVLLLMRNIPLLRTKVWRDCAELMGLLQPSAALQGCKQLFMHPIETSSDVLSAILTTLSFNQLSAETNSFLFEIAVHHVGGYIFSPETRAISEWSRLNLLQQVLGETPGPAALAVLAYAPSGSIEESTAVQSYRIPNSNIAAAHKAAVGSPRLLGVLQSLGI